MFEVEEVSGRVAFRRFHELPHVLHRSEPRWSAPLASWDRARLDPSRNPFFDAGDGAYFLLRRLGRPAGRITAHLAAEGDAEGWFGFFDVIDAESGAAALVDAAATWLVEHGCSTMKGPASFTTDDECGVQVTGFDAPGTTGRPWHPPWYAAHLKAAGLREVRESRRSTWRLPGGGNPTLPASEHLPMPALVGPYGDRRLVLGGPGGAIAAVPDLSVAQGSAWQLAKRARRGAWEGCTVVHVEGDPGRLVPAVQAAAGEAGYEWVIAPWSPDAATKPETEHALLAMPL